MKATDTSKAIIPMDQNANETVNELLSDPTWGPIPEEHQKRTPAAMSMFRTIWYVMPLVMFFAFFYGMVQCVTSESANIAIFGTLGNCIGWLISLEWCEMKYRG